LSEGAVSSSPDAFGREQFRTLPNFSPQTRPTDFSLASAPEGEYLFVSSQRGRLPLGRRFE